MRRAGWHKTNTNHMKVNEYLRDSWKNLVDLGSNIDTEAAERSIRSNVYFKGPNVLILAFSIVIASVGLNVNSTAVIIGAMLISPLMGPIIGVGLSGSISDMRLLRDSAWNLLVMVLISLAASALYFWLSPLELANPTELEARTSPSIYDVLIALFGGSAGIVELARKEKGTVISGVAIATALMPPLCTAGYGLAHWDGHFFFGAMGLFGINAIFIALATYIGAKLMHFREVDIQNVKRARRTRRTVTFVVLAVTALSIWSAVRMIGANNFEINAEKFVAENRTLSRAYIYDYSIDRNNRKVEIKVAGQALSEDARELLARSAAAHGIAEGELTVVENSLSDDSSSERLANIFERSESEIAVRDARIMMLREQIDSLKGVALPSKQIARELEVNYPGKIAEVYTANGLAVRTDSLSTESRNTVIIRTLSPLGADEEKALRDWLKIRTDDENLDVIITPR